MATTDAFQEQVAQSSAVAGPEAGATQPTQIEHPTAVGAADKKVALSPFRVGPSVASIDQSAQAEREVQTRAEAAAPASVKASAPAVELPKATTPSGTKEEPVTPPTARSEPAPTTAQSEQTAPVIRNPAAGEDASPATIKVAAPIAPTPAPTLPAPAAGVGELTRAEPAIRRPTEFVSPAFEAPVSIAEGPKIQTPATSSLVDRVGTPASSVPTPPEGALPIAQSAQVERSPSVSNITAAPISRSAINQPDAEAFTTNGTDADVASAAKSPAKPTQAESKRIEVNAAVDLKKSIPVTMKGPVDTAAASPTRSEPKSTFAQSTQIELVSMSSIKVAPQTAPAPTTSASRPVPNVDQPQSPIAPAAPSASGQTRIAAPSATAVRPPPEPSPGLLESANPRASQPHDLEPPFGDPLSKSLLDLAIALDNPAEGFGIAMTARQKMLAEGMMDAISAFNMNPFEGEDPFEAVKRSILKKVPDATLTDFRQAARLWLTNREFGELVVDLGLKFVDPQRPNETVREILRNAAANGSNQARTLLHWF